MRGRRWRWRSLWPDCWRGNLVAMRFGWQSRLRSSASWRNNIWCEIGFLLEAKMAAKCTHVKDHVKDVKPGSKGCEDCLKTGDTWVHLRMCLECGHVGCCDSSKNRHATKHFHKSKHPLMRSIEPGETWTWCYVDEIEAVELEA